MYFKQTRSTTHRSFYADYLERVKGYHQTSAYQKAINKRKVWVEPLFAEAKEWHRMRRFRLRRLWRVNCEALVTASGQNLKRLLAAREDGDGVRFPQRQQQYLFPPGREVRSQETKHSKTKGSGPLWHPWSQSVPSPWSLIPRSACFLMHRFFMFVYRLFLSVPRSAAFSSFANVSFSMKKVGATTASSSSSLAEEAQQGVFQQAGWFAAKYC